VQVKAFWIGGLVVAACLLSSGTVYSQTDWTCIAMTDSIAGTKTDSCAVRGQWVDGKPSFPFAGAIPMLLVRCSEKRVTLAEILTGVLLQPGPQRIQYRIDDAVGNFQAGLSVKVGDKSVVMQVGDFLHAVTGHTAILRVRGINEALTMKFDLPSSDAKLREKCDIDAAARRESLGGIEVTEKPLDGIPVPAPVGADPTGGTQALHLFFVATVDAQRKFYVAAMPEKGWSQPDPSSFCWTKVGVPGKMCIYFDKSNFVDIVHQQ
jgi:hypothetical protein